tara:strand:+ start:508 stop:792 length:285 start_codon:yes stop_codon:yes gene_type:complete
MTEENDEPLESAKEVEDREEAERKRRAELSPLEKAEETLEAIKSENERMSKLVDRQERLRATEMLGGHSTAGQESKKQVESDSDYAKRVMAGDL